MRERRADLKNHGVKTEWKSAVSLPGDAEALLPNGDLVPRNVL